jgi:hypothetical protein
MKEIWKKVLNGYYYEVSSSGRLRRARPGPHTYVGRLVKHIEGGHPGGYVLACLSVEGELVYRKVHQLVAEAFLGSCPAGKESEPQRWKQAEQLLGKLRIRYEVSEYETRA